MEKSNYVLAVAAQKFENRLGAPLQNSAKQFTFLSLILENFMTNQFTRRATVAIVALVLAACGSSVKLEEAGAPIENRAGSGANKGPSSSSQTGSANNPSDRAVQTVTVGTDPSTDPNNPLSKRSIFFDYDSYEIRQEFRAVVEAHAKYLQSNRDKRVLIAGNTDERGSREYNLALGQKRSEAVRRALAALGVPETQMEAVSYGEEKPRATGAEESGWAENRRADLEYLK
jgi:peptidoglycan-associated lipoprotein